MIFSPHLLATDLSDLPVYLALFARHLATMIIRMIAQSRQDLFACQSQDDQDDGGSVECS